MTLTQPARHFRDRGVGGSKKPILAIMNLCKGKRRVSIKLKGYLKRLFKMLELKNCILLFLTDIQFNYRLNIKKNLHSDKSTNFFLKATSQFSQSFLLNLLYITFLPYVSNSPKIVVEDFD